ncbi:hypothetical protein C3B58_11660 [Lactonifactor longoviformis]|uniref:Uncharacterized protein n=1 Tax=Lactonifactor longoviformis DSM 17459 TaxID=1122155 RepID=A0A1M4TQC4_9CLOT|nr:hypothetical protein [Lactonifactor longoviformis]POP32505.1 hypothetical protein C3B58_11660 [Lactonifactor longoviformis]SHE46586.1 hypothetical protein SAMN02745158_00539 [Lactonifactor longoviformis DSM 17459]
MNSSSTQLPLAVLLNKAEEEIGVAVMNTGKKYSLSATFLDTALTSVGAKIKDMKVAELSEQLSAILKDKEDDTQEIKT